MGNPVKNIYRTLLRPVYARLAEIERRMEEPPNRRFVAVEEIADYLFGAQIPGDYLEFGTAWGRTFSYACNRFSLYPEHNGMKFFALDSFEGLPRPKGLDAVDGYTATFYESQFACSEEEFIENLKRARVNLDRVTLVKGWFDKSLTPENAARHGIDKVAAAWIDCDLYESTVPVLKFITPRLSTGSVIAFDDWRCFRNSPEFGEQRACREWLAENPHITLHELYSFGWHGIAFTVELAEGRAS